MVTVHALRSAAVALDWHEAVAVAAALASLIADAQPAACPAPSDVTLLPTGELRVTGPGHAGATPAQGVALVLGQLLESAPCPAELRQLVEQYGQGLEAGPDALQALRARLAFFERPERADVLATLAARAGSGIERGQRAAALEALTERTRHADAAARAEAMPEPPVGGWDRQPESTWTRWLVPVALGLTAFVGATYAASRWLGPEEPAVVRQRIEDDLAIADPAGTAVEPGSVATAGRNAPGTAGRQGRTGAPSARTDGARPASGASSTAAAGQPAPTPAAPAPVAAPVSRGVDVTIAERDGRVLGAPPARTVPHAPGRVFTQSDPRVTPAVLIRPHLPNRPPPGVPEEQIGTLEFVVAESGAVEHVHLISPANRFQERMLVAAAKTWQFQPAMRDGRPVRFRTRIRVTL